MASGAAGLLNPKRNKEIGGNSAKYKTNSTHLSKKYWRDGTRNIFTFLRLYTLKIQPLVILTYLYLPQNIPFLFLGIIRY
jgi:hypothetical protein